MMSSAPGPNQAHWDEVYRSTPSEGFSWFTEHPSTSLELIRRAALDYDSRIIDVGGGGSLLVDHLLDEGYRQVTVLDISTRAIERARDRLATRANRVTWITDDLLSARDFGVYDVWHDRALFHFLIEPAQRELYVATLVRTVAPGGAVILATFAPDGPDRCSGLQARRYNEQDLAARIGRTFRPRRGTPRAAPHAEER